MRFRDRSVLITGASAGIGRALAIELAREGACLTLAARRAGALADVAKECVRVGGTAEVAVTDVTEPDQCAAMVEQAVAAFGTVDALVNNAGISMEARFDQVTDLSIFERLMRVNYLGAVYATHYALPHLRRQRGLICAMSSVSGKTGVPTRTGYAATKHAMQGFFDSLRIELRNTGVGVLVVSPGFVATDISERMLGPDGAPVHSRAHDRARRRMPVEHCARQVAGAMHARRRELLMTPQARVANAVGLLAPSLVDRLAARTMGDPGQPD